MSEPMNSFFKRSFLVRKLPASTEEHRAHLSQLGSLMLTADEALGILQEASRKHLVPPLFAEPVPALNGRFPFMPHQLVAVARGLMRVAEKVDKNQSVGQEAKDEARFVKLALEMFLPSLESHQRNCELREAIRHKIMQFSCHNGQQMIFRTSDLALQGSRPLTAAEIVEKTLPTCYRPPQNFKKLPEEALPILFENPEKHADFLARARLALETLEEVQNRLYVHYKGLKRAQELLPHGLQLATKKLFTPRLYSISLVKELDREMKLTNRLLEAFHKASDRLRSRIKR